MSAALPDLPVLVMHCATIEGYSLGVTPSELRELIISAADERSVVRGMIELDEPCTQPQSAYFKQTRDHAWVRCGEHEDYHARVNWGIAIFGLTRLRPGQLTPRLRDRSLRKYLTTWLMVWR